MMFDTEKNTPTFKFEDVLCPRPATNETQLPQGVSPDVAHRNAFELGVPTPTTSNSLAGPAKTQGVSASADRVFDAKSPLLGPARVVQDPICLPTPLHNAKSTVVDVACPRGVGGQDHGTNCSARIEEGEDDQRRSLQ